MQLEFDVQQQIIRLVNADIKVVEKSKNYLKCTFCFCDDWQGVTKTAVFVSAKGDIYNVILKNDFCVVPWEVIQYPHFSVSVFGGDLITANKVTVNVIKSGYCKGETPKEPTPDVYTQIMKMIEEIEITGGGLSEEEVKRIIIAELEKAQETGEFDGADGKDGVDGVSCTHSWSGTVLTVTSASGTSSTDLKGDKGDKGDKGADGYNPKKGTDYWTETDKQEMVQDVLNELPNGDEVLY